MPLKLKLDDDGHAVLKNGMPIYVGDDEKEVEVDVPRLFAKVTDLNAENKTRREKADELEGKLAIFKDIDDLEDWKKTADDALEKVQNFQEKDLLDASKVKEIKDAMTAAHEQDKKKLQEQFVKKETEYQGTLSKKDQQIRTLMISSKFAQSKHFVGDDSITLLPPDVAESRFGSHFKISEDKDTGTLKITGFYDTEGKEIIYGNAVPGDPANFEEAISAILERYPSKNAILRAGSAGGGGRGGGDDDGKKKTTDIEKLRKQHKELLGAGKVQEAIVVNNRINILQRQQQASK